MKANQEFLKDPYQSGKNMLGPKRAIQRQCNQDLLDIFITKTLYEPSHNFVAFFSLIATSSNTFICFPL